MHSLMILHSSHCVPETNETVNEDVDLTNQLSVQAQCQEAASSDKVIKTIEVTRRSEMLLDFSSMMLLHSLGWAGVLEGVLLALLQHTWLTYTWGLPVHTVVLDLIPLLRQNNNTSSPLCMGVCNGVCCCMRFEWPMANNMQAYSTQQ
jgi:hypothetical protein